MRIDDIAITPRKRDPWQAVNLGVSMARTWYLPLFLSWAVPAWLFTLLIALIFPGLAAWLPTLMLWWFKPLFDRGPLYIASRRLFGDNIGFWQTLRALPKLYWRDAFWALTYRRFSICRSYDMPVTILENLSGQKRRKRLDVLQREGAGPAFYTLMLLLHVEVFLIFAFAGFVFLMVPIQYQEDFIKLFQHDLSLTTLIYNCLYAVAVALVGPFYSLCGFSQYINRRINLEGWDIELHFRRLLSRTQKNHKQLGASISAAFLFGIFGFFAIAPNKGHAEPHASKSHAQIEAQERAVRILEDDAFNQTTLKSGIRLKKSYEADKEQVPGWLIRLLEWLESIQSSEKESSHWASSLAKFLEVLLWLSLAVIIWLLIKRFAPLIIRAIQKPGEEEDLPPDELFGLDIRTESLPERPDQEVWRLWQAGKHRDALSLLYRATLSELINTHGYAFKKHFTERECYETVRRGGVERLSNYFGDLTRVWQVLAYAHKTPEEHKIKTLCFDWETVLANAIEARPVNNEN